MSQIEKEPEEEEQEEELKAKAIYNPTPNTLTRVSIAFGEKINLINNKRDRDNLRRLTGPKITELIIKHKLWKHIERDLMEYLLDEDTGR